MTEVEFTIVDMDNKVALKNGIGHDAAWGYLPHPDEATPAEAEAFNGAFEIVKDGERNWFHTDGDLYQGSTLMRVIRRKADGKLFGFSYWEGGGKYGETMIEANGEDHGLPSKYDESRATIAEWYVFLPVVEKPLPAYAFEEAS